MAGEWRQIGNPNAWKATTAGVGHHGKLFLIDNGTLYKSDPVTAAYLQLGTGKWNSRFLAATGDALFSVEGDGSLFRISPHDGSWQQLKGNWANTAVGVGCNGMLYLIDSGILYVVNPYDGQWVQLGQGKWNTRILFCDGDDLLMIEHGGNLFKTNVRNGEWVQMKGNWNNTQAVVGLNDMAYAVDSGKLWGTNTDTGLSGVIGTSSAWQSRFLFAPGKNIVSLEANGTLFAINI